MVAILVMFGGLSFLAALIVPFAISDPTGVITIWHRLAGAFVGLGGAAQWFALAAILDGIQSLRVEVDELKPQTKRKPKSPPEIAPPSGWE